MPIEISKGFVSDYSGSSDYALGKKLSPIVSFSLGESPVEFFYLSCGAELLSAGNYIAVAGLRIPFMRGVCLALAYRRLGDMGSAHFMGVCALVVGVLFGLVGAFGFVGIYLGQFDGDLKMLATVLLSIGAFAIWGMWLMHKACRMLNLLESPMATYSHHN